MAKTDGVEWTFFSNHMHVLVALTSSDELVLRNVAARVGITERAVQKIIKELVDSGYVVRTRVGRQNAYVINYDMPLRHPLESHRTIGEIIGVVTDQKSSGSHHTA